MFIQSENGIIQKMKVNYIAIENNMLLESMRMVMFIHLSKRCVGNMHITSTTITTTTTTL